jgi:Na+-transporting methylmalonyl-CoA/oxaloacetate decarboxylase gamma subunit
MAKKPLYAEIFLTSLGALLLEIAYTRIFSFKVFYYFTYLILGIGLLGIGAGGVAVAIVERLRRTPLERLIPITSFAGGASVLVSYLVIAPTQLNVAEALNSPEEVGKLCLVSLLLTSSFFAVGIIVSSILGRASEEASRLYGADLLGAALGAALAVPLISALTPPRTVMLAGLVLATAGIRLARESRGLFVVGLATMVLLLGPLTTGMFMTDPVVARAKSFEDFRRGNSVKFSKWSPVFRIDAADHPFHPGKVFLLFHDGQPGSGMRRFDGDFQPFEYLRTDSRALPFEVLPKGPRVLVIGAAGGHEIVASLFFGASHVTGVELNPVTYSLLTKVYADYSGHLAENPRVTLLNGDGRWFLKQSKDKYDLVWFVAPDSYAAMNAATSGAFVLSESYLYTAEMVKESLRHLTDGGIICTQFGELDYDRKPNRTTRYVATARAAMREEGILPFSDHVLVSSSRGFPPFRELSVLLGKSAFSASQISAFQAKASGIVEGVSRYAPGSPLEGGPVTEAITLPDADLARFFESYRYQVDPVRDNAPFFWHFARFRDAMATAWPQGGAIIDHEDAIAEQLTLTFLAVVVVLAALFLLLPFVTMRSAWKEMPHKAIAATYFACLGLGFMLLEVPLIQTLTLLLGYPTYSLSVTLCALLVFSGTGSILSSQYTGSRKRTLLVLISALAAVVLAARAWLPSVVGHFIGYSLPVRIAVTVFVIAPVGLCLGAFMPLGLRAVGSVTKRPREYIAWAWAVNGFFSVLASILSTILAMVFGFKTLFLIALAVYVVAALAFMRLPDARPRPVA